MREDKPAPGEEFPGISLRAEPRAVLPWDSVPAELHPEREMGEKEGFGVGFFFFGAVFEAEFIPLVKTQLKTRRAERVPSSRPRLFTLQ